ncbi:MAG: hypothetical protein Q9181_003306 [Wetmoreana brouardii]
MSEEVLVPEDELRLIARSFKNVSLEAEKSDAHVSEKYGHESSFTLRSSVLSIRQLESTFWAIVKTARTLQLSEGQAAAACDALRACLTQCEVSKDAHLQALAYDQSTWTTIYDVYLTRSESRIAKPVKLLLLALERNLAKNPSESVRNDLVSYSVSRTWQIVCMKGDNDTIKPALQALRHFMSKSVVQAQDVVLALFKAKQSGEDKQPGSQEAETVSALLNRIPTSQYVEYSHDFLCKVLHWLRHPDTAPITGRLISFFCRSLRIWSSSCRNPIVSHDMTQGNEPIWLLALKSCSKKQPDLLDLFATHVFPEIVRQDREGSADLGSILPLQLLGTGDISRYSPADLQLYLMVLRGLKEHSPFDVIVVGVAEEVGGKLLRHANSQVRTAAFSIVIQSSSPKEPLAETTLRSLRLVLPFYHAEADPKVRQDNLSMIRKLLHRLAGSLNAMHGKGLTPMPTGQRSAERDDSSPVVTTQSRLKPATYQQHLDFYSWYAGFLTRELSPTASYQRHIMSLKVLDSLMSERLGFRTPWDDTRYIGRAWGASQDFFSAEFLTSLVDLVMDPFDDIRELAIWILQSVPDPVWSNLVSQVVPDVSDMHSIFSEDDIIATDSSVSAAGSSLLRALRRATIKMRDTGRADHADGFGRLFDLAFGFRTYSYWVPHQETLWIGKYQLILNCLLANLEQYLLVRFNHFGPQRGQLDAAYLRIRSEIGSRLLHVALHVWEGVKSVLCADAPEGYEVEGQDEPTAVGTKDLLSFCWRALKESSTLMHAMIADIGPTPVSRKFQHIVFDETPIALAFQHIHYQELGELAFTELADLRHRGAFSTVSQTFAACCFQCARSKHRETRALPKRWYQKTILCIQQRSSSLTRRSAGLPAMITGILSAKLGDEFFSTVVRDLQAIAGAEIKGDTNDEHIQLPQVHAFNCLKDIFTDGRFGGSVQHHMSTSLELAVDALESVRWAIRNCGLMLIKALITRLHDGTNTASSRASSSHRRLSTLVYDKYKNLPDLILRLLIPMDSTDVDEAQSEATSTGTFVLRAQRVFPALEVIEQSGIPKYHQAEIRQAVWKHLEGPVWAIRDKAAKALSYLPASDGIKNEMEYTLQKTWSTQNALNGRLLYVRYLYARLRRDADKSSEGILCKVLEHFEAMITSNVCPITRASYTALVADILEAIHDAGSSSVHPSNVDNDTPDTVKRPETFSRIGALVHWQGLTEYVGQDCSDKPQFALEGAAKHRCKPLIKRFNISNSTSTSTPDIHRPNSTDHACAVPHNPEQSDQILRETGKLLGIKATQADRIPKINEELACWIRALKLAQDELADVNTRQAAVDSLADYLDIVKGTPFGTQLSPEMLQLYLILYDSLLDDDEAIRDSGAAAVLKLDLSATFWDGSDDPQVPQMVPGARAKLLDLLVVQYEDSCILGMESVQRLVGVRFLAALPHGAQEACQIQRYSSPSALFEKMSKDDTTLFVEEKQNLYVDEAEEACNWQNVLISVEWTAKDTGVLNGIRRWAAEGVETLIKLTEEEPDGPLGWTSKPDVFTLGVRIILAAEALMLRFEGEGFGIDCANLRSRLQHLLLCQPQQQPFPLGRRLVQKHAGRFQTPVWSPHLM